MKTPHATIKQHAAALCIAITALASPAVGQTTLAGNHVIAGNLNVQGNASDGAASLTLGGAAGVPSQSISVWDDYGTAAHHTYFGSVDGNGYVAWYGGGIETPLIELAWWDGAGSSLWVNGQRVITEWDLTQGVLPQIQAVTLELSQALSIGNATVVGSGSMAAGNGAWVYGGGSLAFGDGAHVGSASLFSNNSIALGNNAQATAHGAMAFGKGAKATQLQNIAIGADSEASGNPAVWWQAGYDWGSIAVGTKAKATGKASAAFGLNAQALASESIAIGPRAGVAASAPAGVALGWEAASGAANGLAIGNSSHAWGVNGIAIGLWTYSVGHSSSILGNYADTNSTGQVVVGTAPVLPAASTNWDDMGATVFVVGAGKPGNYIGGGGWSLNHFAVTRRTAMSVKRNGDVAAEGAVTAKGGINVANTLSVSPSTLADGSRTVKIRPGTTMLVPPGGDISMGEFTAGEQP